MTRTRVLHSKGQISVCGSLPQKSVDKFISSKVRCDDERDPSV
jgi:hypothetical protein